MILDVYQCAKKKEKEKVTAKTKKKILGNAFSKMYQFLLIIFIYMFENKSLLTTSFAREESKLVGVGFYGISTILGYLKLKYVYTHILDLYDM